MQPRVDSEEAMDDIECPPHVVWLDSPQLSGLTGDEITQQHLVSILPKPYI